MSGAVMVNEVCGSSWWGALEGVVGGITCASCREHGMELLSAMHDLVNWKTGKEFYDIANFEAVAREYGRALTTLSAPTRQSQNLDDVIESLTTYEPDGLKNLEMVLEALSPAENRLPACDHQQTEAVRRCVEDLQAEPNPIARCQLEHGCSVSQRLDLSFEDGEEASIETVPEMARRIHDLAEGLVV